jgi:hypothetical protein
MISASSPVDPTVPRYRSIPVEASALSSAMIIVVDSGISKGGKSSRLTGLYVSDLLSSISFNLGVFTSSLGFELKSSSAAVVGVAGATVVVVVADGTTEGELEEAVLFG